MKLRVRRHEVTQPLHESFRYIPLTQGKTAIVDATDFEWLSRHNWCAHRAHSTFYAVSRINDKLVRMHSLILGKHADHKNHDGLDNRRRNLRHSTKSQNAINAKRRCDNTSGYRGIWCYGGGWTAEIAANGRKIRLNGFKTKEAAAHARDDLAKQYQGEFAQLNFPKGN